LNDVGGDVDGGGGEGGSGKEEPPAIRAYIMPAEWERHNATWLAWPKDPLTFPGPKIIEQVEGIYSQMIASLAEGERVELLVDDEQAERRIKTRLGGDVPKNLVFHLIKTADVWMRDYGPIFVRDARRGGIAATKWTFNAWGGKYDELLADDGAGMDVARATGLEIVRPDFVLEGGSIDTNGRGVCLTTEQCLLNRNRNPGCTKDEIEAVLGRYLGFSHMIWLKSGIEGDDTDGHVDDIARFVGESTVVCMVEEDVDDANHDPLRENLELLRGARDQDGKSLTVVPIPMPKKKVLGDGDGDGIDRLPASYANFFIGNSVVLVPTFDDVNDAQALSTIARVFPERRVVGINCEALVYGLGGIHCVTQQQPAAAP
jgi:agmatine deiminase